MNNVQKIIESIISDYNQGRDIDKTESYNQPNKATIIDLINKLQRILYPGYFHDDSFKSYNVNNHIAVLIEDVAYKLSKQIALALKYDEDKAKLSEAELKEMADKITENFLSTIPKLREYLNTDLEAFYDGDPAAYSKDEIIYAYPGFYTITVYRLAHELLLLGVPVIPRIMTEHAHSMTGIDIHPGATIDKYFFIDHGTGIVVGETTIIGKHVKVYQGVTIGALSTRGGQALSNIKRHPTIEDNVTIYSNSTILGGETVIGADSVIGGNTFITSSVPAGSKVSMSK